MRLAMIRILDDLGYPHFSKRPTNDDVFKKKNGGVKQKCRNSHGNGMGWQEDGSDGSTTMTGVSVFEKCWGKPSN